MILLLGCTGLRKQELTPPAPPIMLAACRRGRRLPGPVNPWGFGYIWTIKQHRDRGEWWLESRRMFERYGPLVGLRVLTGSYVLVSDPELARVIVTGSADAFPKGAL